jgi:AcrR family transcriptional regulator
VFSNREDCFLAAFDHAVSEARLIVADAFERESCWQDRIRCALAAFLAYLDERPDLARLFVVEAPGAGRHVLHRRAELLQQVAHVVDEGRLSTKAGRQPTSVAAEGVVGAVLTVLHLRLLDDRREPLSSLLGPLMSMIVLPYLGAGAARRELSRPSPDVAWDRRARLHDGKADPLEGLSMRLTYRTLRVLMVLAEHPGASNRMVAEGSDVVDHGQISKLLSRLARLGLAENVGRGQQKGAPNAWRLTAHGARLERAARPLR